MRTIILLLVTTLVLSLATYTVSFTSTTSSTIRSPVSFVTRTTDNDLPYRMMIQSTTTRTMSNTQSLTTSLYMSEPSSSETANKRPFWFDPNTKGGALVLMVVLFVVPVLIYNILISVGGVDEIEAGITIGIGFTIISTVAWVSTYVFRVATKDMTYAKQLKDYENAVIAKRLEELDEDEIQALVEEVEKDNF